MSKEQPPKSVEEVAAERIGQVRTAQRLSQQDLADRLAAIGAPVDRSVIARMEGGQRGLSVNDLVRTAAALRVSPTMLMTYRSGAAPVAVAPTIYADSLFVRQWIMGTSPLNPEDAEWFYQEIGNEHAGAFVVQEHRASRAVSYLERDVEVLVEMKLGRATNEDRAKTVALARRDLEEVISTVNQLVDEMEGAD